VLSETSAAVDVERHLRALAASAPRTKAFKVELNAKVASMLVGPGASRLMTIEEELKRRFLLVFREDVPVNHFEVLGKGTLESQLGDDTRAEQEGKQVELKLGEVGRHDVHAGVGKVDGLTVVVGNAAPMVGKKAKVRIERVLDGVAYASLVGGKKAPEEPITAESAAEKPTRKPPAKKQAEAAAEPEAVETAEPEVDETGEAEPAGDETPEAPADQPAKKKTRRGSRGGRRRKKKPAGATAEANGDSAAETPAETPAAETNGQAEGPKIHLPDPSLGREEAPEAEAPSANGEGDEQPKPKKKTRRGSRGGRNRRRRSGSGAGAASAESTPAE
jgi:predicted RNA-binding protein with TRAM domain